MKKGILSVAALAFGLAAVSQAVRSQEPADRDRDPVSGQGENQDPGGGSPGGLPGEREGLGQQEYGREEAGQQEARIDAAAVGEILSQLHQTNQMEILMGQMAQEKGQSARIKRFGTLLVRDHQFGDKKILALARDKGVEMGPMEHSYEHQQMLDRLQSAGGEEFDRAFLQAQAEGHRRAIALLESAKDGTGDPDVDGLIAKQLPIIRQHYDLSANLGGERATEREQPQERQPREEPGQESPGEAPRETPGEEG